MRILIFGCGYLGRRVAAEWIQAGHTIFAATRSSQNAETLLQLEIHPLIGDVCDPATLANLPEVDVVLHAIGFDRNSGRSHEEVTCGGTRNILEAVNDRCRRFIQISSTSVYGQSAGEWVDENSVCEPVQVGGQMAVVAEWLVRDSFPETSGIHATILRLAGIYGPGRLLSRIESLRAGTPILGRGDSWLNLIHVDDAVRAIVKCATIQAAGTTYNVVDDRPIERREYFSRLAQLIGAPEPTFDANQPAARGAGGLNKRCSNYKLREAVGWTPTFTSIDSGLPASIGI